MPTLPNMGLITPTAGGDRGTWDDKINACFVLTDAHDHTSGKGVAITTAALDIDDDLDLDGNALINVDQLEFTARTTLAAGSNIFFVDDGDNELYFRSSGGTNIQITNAGTLDISGTGGIVGDYASTGAEVSYDSANKRYTFSTHEAKWARVACGPVRIYEYDTTEAVYVEHAVAAGLASSYTVTWPAAAPAATTTMLMDTSGNITVAAITEQIPAAAAHTLDTNNTFSGHVWNFFGPTTTNAVIYPIRVRAGASITGISVKINKLSDATDTVTMELVESDGTGAFAAVAAFTATNSDAGGGDKTLTGTGTQTATAGKQYAIRVYHSDGTPSGAITTGVATVTHT